MLAVSTCSLKCCALRERMFQIANFISSVLTLLDNQLSHEIQRIVLQILDHRSSLLPERFDFPSKYALALLLVISHVVHFHENVYCITIPHFCSSNNETFDSINSTIIQFFYTKCDRCIDVTSKCCFFHVLVAKMLDVQVVIIKAICSFGTS